MGKPYRILSLDGGGTWAMIQIMALQKIYAEHTRGHLILKDFDLVAANSGGSITAAGLIANLPLSEILEYFCDPRCSGQIFSPLTYRLVSGPEPFRYVLNKLVRSVLPIGAKYRTGQKLRGLQAVVTDSPRVYRTRDGKPITSGDYKLWELPHHIKGSAESDGHHVDFLICAFNYNRQRAKFFRSNSKSKSSSSRSLEDATLCEAIHASTNAPVNFFVSPARVQKDEYWDGAIAGLNNPALVAVTEAVANGVDPADIQVLSLGTGSVSLPSAGKFNADDPRLLSQPRQSSLLADVGDLASSVLDDPPDTATYVSHVMTSAAGTAAGLPGNCKAGRVVRMSPLVRPRRLTCDRWTTPAGFTADEFSDLTQLELDATSVEDVRLLQALGKAWIAGDVANQPIRETSTLEVDVGHATFAAALEHWQALMAAPDTRGGKRPDLHLVQFSELAEMWAA